MSANNDGLLRHEASPMRYDRLDETQKAGFQRITEALADAVAALDEAHRKQAYLRRAQEPSACPWSPWRPNPDRRANLVFLSGERGTGKTTLWLSVVAQFLDPKNSGLSSAEALRGELLDLSQRILWLAPIDMEPLPQPSNLFAAILARIEHALDHQIGQGEDPSRDDRDNRSPRGLLDNPLGQGSYRECRNRLRLLQRDVSTAWNSNLAERAGKLDSDEYFHEVVRSERARVGLPDDLDKLLDYLAGEAPWQGGLKDPLFVLPIDDIDLNPAQAVALLNLVRTISSKRLFTLILGDIRLMERVLEHHIAGSLSKLRHGLHGDDKRLLNDASKAASEGLRKLIPPGQRIHLSKLRVTEALPFKYSDDEPPLEYFLKKKLICLHPVGALAKEEEDDDDDRKVSTPAQANFGDLYLSFLNLLADSVVKKDAPLKDKLNSRFLGLRLLSATPRFLADLSLSLKEISTRPGAPADADGVEDEDASKAWLEQSHQDIVALVARRFLDTAPSERERAAVWEHEPRRWCLDRTKFHWQMTTTERRSVRLDDFRLEVPRLNEAQVFVVPPEEEDTPEDRSCGSAADNEPVQGVPKRSGEKLNSDCAASLSLLHDLLALQFTKDEETLSSVIGSPLFSRAEKYWATICWDRSGMAVNWRLPEWLSVGEYSLFVDYWTSAHAKIIDSDPETQVDYFLFAWIAGATNVLAIPLLGDDRSQLVALPDYPKDAAKDLPWDELSQLLQKIFLVAKDHKNDWALSEFVRIANGWAVDLAMILAPESGTRDVIAEKFLNNSDLTNVWLTGECCGLVRRKRAEQCLGRCDPYMLGLIAPEVAFDAIASVMAGPSLEDGDSMEIGNIKQQWCEAMRSGGPAELEALSKALDNLDHRLKPTARSDGRRPADCLAGLQLAFKHNPEYNFLDAAAEHGGLSPSEIDLQRYAKWPPNSESD